MKSRDELHVDLLTIKLASWHDYTIIHAMIDAGQVTSIECQMHECALSTRAFAIKATRGQADAMTLDHINERRNNGSHKISNLRIVHNCCNVRRKQPDLVGRHHTPETRERLRITTCLAHADGRMKKIYTPERNAKIGLANRGKRTRLPCLDCGRDYAVNWINRHRDEGRCHALAMEN